MRTKIIEIDSFDHFLLRRAKDDVDIWELIVYGGECPHMDAGGTEGKPLKDSDIIKVIRWHKSRRVRFVSKITDTMTEEHLNRITNKTTLSSDIFCGDDFMWDLDAATSSGRSTRSELKDDEEE